MPLFVMTGLDKPDALEMRMAARPAHLDWIEGLGDAVNLAGPLLSDDGERPIGSLIIINAADLNGARSVFSSDPYTLAGLWAEQTIRPFKQVKP